MTPEQHTNPDEQRKWANTPYVGPRSFSQDETLYGRDKEITDLYYLLAAERVVLMYSPSGAGKTSLIQAGLIPRLVQEGYSVLPEQEGEKNQTIRAGILPDRSILSNRYLAAVLLRLAPEAEIAQQKPSELTEAIKKRLSERREGDKRQVLIFDQFEEVLTQDRTDHYTRREFFQQLGMLLAPSPEQPPPLMLFAMREEYIAALEPYRRFIPTQFRNTFRLNLLPLDAAVQAIRQPPWEKHAVVYENDVLVDLLDKLRMVKEWDVVQNTMVDRRGQFVEPLMLQVVCYSLWEKWAAGRQVEPHTTIRMDDYEQLADKDATNAPRSLVDTALESYYEDKVKAVAAAVNSSERHIRDWIEEQMIVGDMRRLVTLGDIPPQMLPALDRLRDAYLVRQESHWSGWYELAHDRLVEPVRQNNAAWREENLSLLQRQAALWEQENRAEGLLLQDRALREAEHWAETHADEMTEGEQEFLEAGQRAREAAERERRKNRFILGLAIVALVLLVVALVALGIAETQRRTAEARTLAYWAQTHLESDPESGLLLAIEAASRGRSPLVEGVLHKAIRASLVRQRLQGHTDIVMQAVYSPDGQRIVSASADTTARVWDTATGKQVRVLEGHTDRVNDATFSPDGQRVATASSDDTARVWNATTGEEMLLLDGHADDVTSVAFSPDGRRIATTSWDTTARVWDATTGEEVLRLVGHGDQVFDVSFSPDGQHIATAGFDDTARVWDATTGEEMLLLDGHEGGVWVAAFSPDGHRIATASYDGTARVWNATTGEEEITIEGNADGAGMSGVAFSPDGQHLATVNWGDTVRVWETTWGTQRSVLRGHEGNVNSAAYRPDGQRIVTTDDGGNVWVWAAQPGEEVLNLTHTATVWSATFSPDGQRIVTTSADTTARVWDALGNTTAVLEGHEGSVYNARFSPDGQHILTAGSDSTARLWDAATGEERMVLHSNNTVYCAAFSPDGQRIATASADRTITVWDAAAGVQVMTLSGHDDNVVSVAFSPDGRRIVSASSDMTARVWDAASGEELLTLEGHTDWVNDAAFSPDGQRIVTASSDQTARVWDATTGRVVITLEGHEGEVYGVSFSPDGQDIVTASWDETARLWNAASGEEIVRMEYGTRLHDAAFSPDGRLFVTAGENGTAHLSYTEFADVLALARQRVTRSLTEEERARYLGD